MIRFDRSRLRDGAARERGLSLMEQTLDAISPSRLVRDFVAREGDILRVGTERYPLGDRRVLLLGAGKAAAAVAQELEAILGDALTAGVVVTRYGYVAPTKRVRVVEGGHPLPDSNGVAGAMALQALAKTARGGDLVLCTFSGGGSALLSLPPPGIDLADLRALNETLLRSGAPIGDVNVVRRHVAPLLGGELARLLVPAQLVTLLLSDVVGDSVEAIASGPTVPDPTTFQDAKEVLSRLAVWEQVPRSIRDRIERGLRGWVQETPKPGDPVFARANAFIVGNNRTAVAAALEEGKKQGFSTQAVVEPIVGEARTAGERLARLARDSAASSARTLLVAGGETTVTVRGPGRGGRNQEVALAAALELEGTSNLMVAALATDGTDGPTDAAGGIVDGQTAVRARAAGFDPAEVLQQNNSHPLLLATGDLLSTGPTRTNVADLFFVFHDPDS
jgi:hydroxypyruvate reductase